MACALGGGAASSAGCSGPPRDDAPSLASSISSDGLPIVWTKSGDALIDPRIVPDPPYYFETKGGPPPTVSSSYGVHTLSSPTVAPPTPWVVDLSTTVSPTGAPTSALPPIRDQGPYGTCLSFAFTAAVEAEYKLLTWLSIEPVRARLQFGFDAALALIAGQRVQGVDIMPEAYWPYGGVEASDADQYATYGIDHADQLTANPVGVRAALDAGRTVVMGLCWDDGSVTGAYDEALVVGSNGLPFGRRALCTAAGLLGGLGHTVGAHAVLLVGYRDDPTGTVFKFRNSWGAGWGDGGYGTVSDGYLNLMGYYGYVVTTKP
jgi:hypothetical protein